MQDLTHINYVQTVDDLTALYRAPSAAAMDKVASEITPLYRDWIMASRFCVLATYAQGRVDISPRGDDGPVVDVLDAQHLALPDWRGNNRLDSLRNIVRDGSLSIIFFNKGVQDVVRVVGHGRVTADTTMCHRYVQNGHHPKTVVIVRVHQIYVHCAKSVVRSGLWRRDGGNQVPTIGDFLSEAKGSAFDGAKFDQDLHNRIPSTLWGDD